MSDSECLQSLLICFQYLMYSAYYNSFSFAFFGSGIKPNLGFSWDVNFVTGGAEYSGVFCKDKDRRFRVCRGFEDVVYL